jgi:hypothetical protein
MKRLLPLFCIVVILFASAGVASANSSQPDQFTITGTGAAQTSPLPNNYVGFKVTAAGDSVGYLQGPFTFKEEGVASLVTLRGVNTGLLTINKKNNRNSQVTIWFGGTVDYTADPQKQVRGTWHVINGEGAWKKLQGHGTYAGNAGDAFTVVFTGDFD